MEVDAMSASIDLRDPKEDEVDQLFGKVGAVGHVLMQSMQGLGSVGRNVIPGEASEICH
jgi:hypothetical protein